MSLKTYPKRLVLALVVMAVVASPSVAQDPFFEISPLNGIRLRRAEAAQEAIRFWAAASPDRPAPTVIVPETYPSNPFADFRESERATIERRARAIVARIVSMPSFKGRDVRITVEPELERTRGKWDMLPGASLSFTVAAGGSTSRFQIQLGHERAQLRTNELDAGSTMGGCARAMIEKGEERGQEFLAQQGDIESAVGGLRITPERDAIADDPLAVVSPISAGGRVLAALHDLSCRELIALANAVEADEDERLAPEF